ncbi:MAG: 2-oxoglutarate dehydrogenase E1 component [endosymbiont of Galathealinum brachiosum]|uniref:2-oxoglutarate dehydrogenase E1 component n=1 Tax=endosymbiont of Galathealinum brachiosum TaxID=2200906 RepID=A0A370DBS9_9GAMM|nr:MAG: 2-oxoglutarate dehydrogenase E1 component [endosymbiont of Galathealinum brachiosum]
MSDRIKTSMQDLWENSMLDAGSAAWLEGLYESYLQNPNNVDTNWREYFGTLPRINGALKDTNHSDVREQFRRITEQRSGTLLPPAMSASTASLEHERKQVSVLQLINAYRFRGHQKADIDPLGRDHTKAVDDLSLVSHELNNADLQTIFSTGSLCGPTETTLQEIVDIVSAAYCGSIGVEYMHITETGEKRWIQQRIETVRGKANLGISEKKNLLKRLTAAEGLEKYLHTKYVGQKRFSLEGGETLIPLVHELVHRSASHGMKEVVIGMAHRGRLNVLVNVMGKTPAELFSEFEGTKSHSDYMGDVKYHLGFSSDLQTEKGDIHLALAFNPSHLEIVAPVVEGSVRARQEHRKDAGGVEVLPIQIHGDAAFSGQGVVMETLQMSQSRGYSTKGSLHIVVNNQIGFTTSNIQDSRSTHYCTDIAKMVDSPIFHVNADDPEAVMLVTQIALDYRMAFKKDVVIDLICYRRHGHNEADEPAATQPMMYKKISNLESTRTIYAEKLLRENIISSDYADNLMTTYRDELDAGNCVVPGILKNENSSYAFHINWHPYENTGQGDTAETAINMETLRLLCEQLEKRPAGFELQPRVEKIMIDRHRMAVGALDIDWGFAETLAYASLVTEGHAVRLSGQDSGRGTFFHRHAVWHNQIDGSTFVPLRNMSEDQANFLVIDSLLSEVAVLAFEYGFATAEPETLVIWEAQFGDFANGAQVVIDQFIVAGEQKWGRLCGLTMLLPHGYEGQGAEHSSARLERYLQLCAQNNIQVCVPSTPAQMFHMMRRQMVRKYRKPLIVMTPKSLLRHKLAVNTLDDICYGSFRSVIDEIDKVKEEDVKRVIMCSGKVYYELLILRRESALKHVVIIRIEELYPFPAENLNVVLDKYNNAEQLIWCQEEPKNQGAWDYFEPRFAAKLDHPCMVEYVGREPSAAPAVGSAKVHAQQQKKLVREALGLPIES